MKVAQRRWCRLKGEKTVSRARLVGTTSCFPLRAISRYEEVHHRSIQESVCVAERGDKGPRVDIRELMLA